MSILIEDELKKIYCEIESSKSMGPGPVPWEQREGKMTERVAKLNVVMERQF
jgi:hypothetical protein